MQCNAGEWRLATAEIHFALSLAWSPHNRVGHIAPSCSSKLLPVVFLFLLVYYLRKQLSFSKSEWFWAVSNLHIWAYLAILGIFGHMGIWAYVKKIWSSGVSPKKALRMQLRDVDLRSVGHSSQKLWPKTFFGIKMPCILHYNAKKITNSSKSLRFWKTQLFSQIIDQKEQKKQLVEV